MAGVLQHLRSSALNKRPNPASMVDGQIAINYASGAPGMFFKDSSGSLVKVGPVHVGSSAPNAVPASGGTAGNSLGEQWLDTSGGTYVFKIWDGAAWRSEAGEFVNTTGDTMTGALGIITGSASTPGLFFSGDANTGIYSPGADQVAISTNGVQRINIEADGDINIDSGGVFYDATNNRLAIGTTSPGVALHVDGDIRCDGVYGETDTNTSIQFPGSDVITFNEGGSEAARIDSSGRLLVGTSTARANLLNSTSSPRVQVEGINTDGSSLALITSFASATAGASPIINLCRAGSTALGSNTVVASGNYLGQLIFSGNDGSEFVSAASIDCQVDGTPGANDMPGRLVFSTTADGAGSPTEQLRITSDRYIRLASGTGGIQFNGDTAAANALDDYEEGTWTPALAGSTTAGTYETSFASGWYTKIGRQVTVQFRVNLAGSITGGGVGFAVITGLPFNTSTDNYANGGSVLLSGVDFNDSAKHLYLYKRSTASAQLVISEVFDNASAQDVGIADFAASSIVAGSLIYFIS
jgi:hypothetical protein